MNKMITRIYHKKNELFQVEFYQDKECTNLIKQLPYPENAKKSDISNFYIELKEGDITPITSLLKLTRSGVNDYFYTPYVPSCQSNQVKTLDDIAVNLSKYIPEDNAVLFLSEEDVIFQPKAGKGLVWKSIAYSNHKGKGMYRFREIPYPEVYETLECLKNRVIANKITIFLTHGTKAELQKAIEIAKQLKEECGVNEVNLFVLHCFITLYGGNDYINGIVSKGNDFPEILFFEEVFNKIITTNSTGMLLPQDNERLQILDCYDIFNDYLKEE